MDPNRQPELRQGLHEMAEQLVPPGIADRALAGATSLRRRRRVLTAASALGVIGVIGVAGAVAIPLLGAAAGDPAVPGASPSSPLVCQTATNEPVPPTGERDDLPVVVRLVVDLLPPRDDYHIGYAFTACERDDQWVYLDGQPVDAGQEVARVQLSVGADDSGGRVKVEIYRETYLPVRACADLPTPPPDEELLFCDDPIGDGPMLVGSTFRGEIAVISVFADGRGIVVENDAPSIDIDLMRTIATDPALLALAG